jgi:hypothetical protein
MKNQSSTPHPTLSPFEAERVLRHRWRRDVAGGE